MRIRVTGHSKEPVFPFEMSADWQRFAGVFSEKGYVFCDTDLTSRTDLLVCNSHSDEIIQIANNQNIPLNNRHLIVWEPEIVDAKLYTKEVLKQYGHIYAPSPIWASKVNGHSFKWPQSEIDANQDLAADWNDRSHQVVLVQGNKFSARKGEQYSLRREVIRRMRNSQLALYGTNWNQGIQFDWMHWSWSAINTPIGKLSPFSWRGIGRHYSQYQGQTLDKIETLSQSTICLVIENSSDFVSEKLFDSLKSGCVTVYVGPQLSEFSIPESAVILASESPKNIVHILKTLLNKRPEDLLEIAKMQRESILPVAQEWTKEKVLPNLAKMILEKVNSGLD